MPCARHFFMDKIQLLIIDKDYLNDLRKFEPRIPYEDYGEGHYKPFVGPLFKLHSNDTNEIYYVSNITSPKPRHERLKGSLDMLKLKNRSGHLLGVVNLNYMFPVPAKYVKEVTANILKNGFYNKSDKAINTLYYELSLLEKSNVRSRANKVYFNKITNEDPFLAQRSFDFLNLNTFARSYAQTRFFEHKRSQSNPKKHKLSIKIK